MASLNTYIQQKVGTLYMYMYTCIYQRCMCCTALMRPIIRLKQYCLQLHTLWYGDSGHVNVNEYDFSLPGPQTEYAKSIESQLELKQEMLQALQTDLQVHVLHCAGIYTYIVLQCAGIYTYIVLQCAGIYTYIVLHFAGIYTYTVLHCAGIYTYTVLHCAGIYTYIVLHCAHHWLSQNRSL